VATTRSELRSCGGYGRFDLISGQAPIVFHYQLVYRLKVPLDCLNILDALSEMNAHVLLFRQLELQFVDFLFEIVELFPVLNLKLLPYMGEVRSHQVFRVVDWRLYNRAHLLL
jgi:hypothetical protein